MGLTEIIIVEIITIEIMEISEGIWNVFVAKKDIKILTIHYGSNI
jgi:hypothetical protein